MILDEAFLRKLEQLSFNVRHIRPGQTAGERRSTKHGTSVEFADYRDYARGDDLRRVDWNIYARLERPLVKLFEEEEDLAVHLLLDASASMDWGGEETGGQGDKGTGGGGDRETRRPPDHETKWGYARRLAAALGYVALSSGDRLTVATLQSPISDLHSPISTLHSPFGPARGRGHTLRLFDWLMGLEAGGTTELNATLRAYAVAAGRPGLAVLISDLFSPAGYLEGLTALAARGHEVAVLHTLARDEIEPPLAGDLRLVDVETGAPQEVTIDAHARTLYRRRLAAWRDEIQSACRARGVRYVSLETDMPLDRLVLYELRRARLLR